MEYPLTRSSLANRSTSVCTAQPGLSLNVRWKHLLTELLPQRGGTLSPVAPVLVYFSRGKHLLWLFPQCNNLNSLLHCRVETSPLISSKSCVVHKSFESEGEAYLWIQVALLKGVVELIN